MSIYSLVFRAPNRGINLSWSEDFLTLKGIFWCYIEKSPMGSYKIWNRRLVGMGIARQFGDLNSRGDGYKTQMSAV